MVVEKNWYNFTSSDLYFDNFPKKYPRGVPLVIEFTIRDGFCPGPGEAPPPKYACASSDSSCANVTNGDSYICNCRDGYDGNPYIPNGCHDIDECALRDSHPELRALYPCSRNGICMNRPGGYDCPCKRGMSGDGKAGTCSEKFPLQAKIVVVKRLIYSQTCFYGLMVLKEITVYSAVVGSIYQRIPSTKLL
ncbi:hypothetical protein EE612_050314, partial [Oryza sativa]